MSGLLAIPVVMAATYAARRWPPPLSPKTLRRIVFSLLFLSGVSSKEIFSDAFLEAPRRAA